MLALAVTLMVLAADSSGIIVYPHAGAPVVVTAGSTFHAVVRGEGVLTLVKDGESHEMATTWGVRREGMPGVSCRVGDEVRPGAYDLKLAYKEGATVSKRSVYVVESMPSEYVFAHVSGVEINDEEASREQFRAIAKGINESDAAFVCVSGRLTAGGTEEQRAAFLEILRDFHAPTVVTPMEKGVFGGGPFVFHFGGDGYLFFDATDLSGREDLGNTPGLLQRLRRAIKPERWAIGVTQVYEVDMDVRTQLVLFVDNPLDVLLVTDTSRGEGDEEPARIPWGKTKLIATPPVEVGGVRYIRVTEQGIVDMGEGRAPSGDDAGKGPE